MKNKLKVLLSCLIVACTLGAWTACGAVSNGESNSVTSEVSSEQPETSEATSEQPETSEVTSEQPETSEGGEAVVNKYTVTFDGTDVAAQTVKEGEKAERPADPAGYAGEDGYNYIFDAWLVKDTDTAYDFDAAVTGDVTLVASFTKGSAIEYTATFVANGEAAGTVTYTVEDKEITAPAVPNKDGYTGAWETYELAIGGVTVNAVYTAIEYTATFVVDGEKVGAVTYTVKNTEIDAPAVPSKRGYTGAWEKYELAIGGITVNAVYTANSYQITYDANGGSVESETQDVVYGQSYTLATPTAGKVYQEFLGWVDVDGNAYVSGDAWMKDSNVTLKAQYSNVISFDSMTEVPSYLQNGGRASLAIVEGNGGKVLQATSEKNDQGNVRIMMPLAYMAQFFEDSNVQYMAFDLKLPEGATTPVNSIMYHNLDQTNYTSYETGDPGKSGSQFDTTPTDAFKSYYLPRSVYEAWVANGKTEGRFLNVQAGITQGASYWIDNIRPVTADEYTADLYSFETGSLRNMTTEIGYCTPNYNQFHFRITGVNASKSKFTNEIVSDGNRAIEFVKNSGESVLMFNTTDTEIKLASRAAGYIAFDLYVPEGSDMKVKHHNQAWYGALKQGWNTVYEKVSTADNNIIRFVDTTASTYVIDNLRLLTEEEYNQAMFGFEAGGVLRDNNSNDATANGGWMYYYAGWDKANNKCSIGISEGTGANDVATLSNVRFATEKTHGGAYSLAFDKKAGYLSMHMAADSAMYSYMKNGFTFWIYSTVAMDGESDIQFINGVNGKFNDGNGVSIPANVWTKVTVSASDIHSSAGRFLILQGATEGTIYIDDFQPLK